MNKNRLIIFGVLGVVLLFSECASAQSSSNKTAVTEPVRIIVTESDSTPVEYANVSINGQNAGTTDGNGVVTVNNFSGGQISVSKDGYLTNTVSAIMESGKYKREQVIWLMRSGGTNNSTYSRGSLSRGQLRDMSTGLGAAIIRVSRNLMRSLPTTQKIAVMNCTAADEDTGLFVIDGVEQQLFDNNYSLVDRSELDKILAEQNFQLSGYVDDNQIVSIGKMAAAKIVITGRINTSGTLQSLTLRALDVETGEVVSRASDQF